MKTKLLKDIEYAKNSFSKELMYQALGMVKMAFELGAITKEEYFELDHKLIYEGLNDREFIKVWNADLIELVNTIKLRRD